MFIFNLKFLFINQIFSKWHPSGCALALDFLLEEGFLQSSFCSGGIQFSSAGNKMRKATDDQHPCGALRVSRIGALQIC
jgi:hypothetical protein